MLTDVLPAGTTFVSATGGGLFNRATKTVRWSLDRVGPGGGEAQPVAATSKVAASSPYGKYAATDAFQLQEEGSGR